MKQEQSNKHIMIIGAGASGMAAAISAAAALKDCPEKFRITVFEHAEQAGSKILVSGNGRCNLGNRNRDLVSNYHSDSDEFLNIAFSCCSMEENESWFGELGILMWERSGYLYPLSRQSNSVRQVFLNEMERLGVKVRYSTEIVSAGVDEEGFYAQTDSGYRYRGDVLILANGSSAGKVKGADSSGYRMAASMGLQVSEKVPSLTYLKVKEPWKNKLSGLRAICTVSVPLCKLTEYGEVQFTDLGISGIPVFQVSGAVGEKLLHESMVKAELNFLPDYKEDDIRKELIRRIERNPEARIKTLLDGLFHEKLKELLLERCFKKASGCLKDISEEQLSNLIREICHFEVTITGHGSEEEAQVIRGGVLTKELYPESMQSRKTQGLFVTGELVNVDGKCGGYNLQWAFTSGRLAGRAAAAYVREMI